MSDSQLYIYIFSEHLPGVSWNILRSPETPGEPVELPGELQGAPESPRQLQKASGSSLGRSGELPGELPRGSVGLPGELWRAAWGALESSLGTQAAPEASQRRFI